MTHLARRWPLVGLVLAVVAIGSRADAQYFGRNKVQYERFDFRIMKTDHLEHYFYPAESLATSDMARAGERWYSRLSDIFRHQFDRKAVVWYADHPDFQQTNVGGSIEEGTGGITEGLRTRVVMPHTGSYWDTHHVLGHELVHVFQYNIAEAGPGGLNRLAALPLWLVEGMAEYLSLGRNDPLTAMWLRDATLRDKLPTIKQLNTDPRYFPYRYGQALWAYVAGRYGDRAVVDIYRASLRVGWDQALVRVLGVNQDSLSKDWIASIKATYTPLLADRTKPTEAGDPVLRQSSRGGDYNLA
ncbi:MAG TPA: basic secretory protein-like protein, partial [Gemmatimonadaceae bacterium]|nr:basic secretory protein-like protein [Gemmatimonadaceae bacterium]